MLELRIHELEDDLDIINMELLTANWDDRENKLKLRKSILDSLNRLNDRLNKA